MGRPAAPRLSGNWAPTRFYEQQLRGEMTSPTPKPLAEAAGASSEGRAVGRGPEGRRRGR